MRDKGAAIAILDASLSLLPDGNDISNGIFRPVWASKLRGTLA